MAAASKKRWQNWEKKTGRKTKKMTTETDIIKSIHQIDISKIIEHKFLMGRVKTWANRRCFKVTWENEIGTLDFFFEGGTAAAQAKAAKSLRMIIARLEPKN